MNASVQYTNVNISDLARLDYFARKRFEFICNCNKEMYEYLIAEGMLMDYLNEVQIEANQMYEKVIEVYVNNWNVDGQMKKTNPAKWCELMKVIDSEAKLFVLNEIIYR